MRSRQRNSYLSRTALTAVCLTLLMPLSITHGQSDLKLAAPSDISVEQLPTPPVHESVATYLDYVIHPLRSDRLFMGAVSCAAASCHGGPRPGVAAPTAPRGSEYQLWFENDPHARSAQTMCSAQSVAMLERLNILRDGRILDQAGYDNCLACHDTSRPLTKAHAGAHQREGVGCAACHGPDADWINNHYQNECAVPPGLANGFVSLSDLVVRARMCAACHVGDRDRDMNHDIIAAGHPTLRYEFASYHNQLPKHWREAQAGNEQQFSAQLWLAGQITSLDASLALLESRAASRLAVSTWPELSEYKCAACHHELRVVDIADSQQENQQRASLARYSHWHRAGFTALLELRRQQREDNETDASLWAAIDDIERIMNSAAEPDRDAVTAAAGQARRVLDQWIQNSGRVELSSMDAYRLNALAHAMSTSRELSSSWEASTQFYLAAVAGRAAWPNGMQGPALAAARDLQRALRYPPDRAETSFPFDQLEDTRVTQERLQTLIESLRLSLSSRSFGLE